MSRKLKPCPFRIHGERRESLTVAGEFYYNETFMPCMGKECACFKEDSVDAYCERNGAFMLMTRGGDGVSIEQEKMIVESLSSIYPMQKFEEDAIETVLDALPRWIPVTERLPEEEGFYLVTLEDKCGAETTIRFFRIENGEHQWSVWGNETITAWKPIPEPFEGVNV